MPSKKKPAKKRKKPIKAERAIARKKPKTAKRAITIEKPKILERAITSEKLSIEYMPLEKLQRASRNPKDHDLGALHQSLGRFDFVSPLILNDATGRLVVGHGRLDALQRLKAAGAQPPGRIQKKGNSWLVPVVRGITFKSDDEAMAYLLADNRLTELGGWHEDQLAQVLGDLAAKGENALVGVGYDTDDLDAILQNLAPGSSGGGVGPPARSEEAKELQKKWGTKRGQIWRIGRHVLMCGDMTKKADVEKWLPADSRGQMVFTDPPYLMEFEGAMDSHAPHKTGHKQMAGDKMAKTEGHFFLSQLSAFIKQRCSGAFYICFHRLKVDALMNALTANGLQWRAQIIWYKNRINLSNSDYKSMYEPIIYGWNEEHQFSGSLGQSDVIEIMATQEDPDVRISGDTAYLAMGDRFFMLKEIKQPKAFIEVHPRVRLHFFKAGETDVWEVKRTKVNDLHPTMKPVALPVMAMRNSSKPNDIVLDPFVGSGTTIVAAEMANRVCFAMEIDPKYVAVTLERLSEMDGLVPEVQP